MVWPTICTSNGCYECTTATVSVSDVLFPTEMSPWYISLVDSSVIYCYHQQLFMALKKQSCDFLLYCEKFSWFVVVFYWGGVLIDLSHILKQMMDRLEWEENRCYIIYWSRHPNPGWSWKSWPKLLLVLYKMTPSPPPQKKYWPPL